MGVWDGGAVHGLARIFTDLNENACGLGLGWRLGCRGFSTTEILEGHGTGRGDGGTGDGGTWLRIFSDSHGSDGTPRTRPPLASLPDLANQSLLPAAKRPELGTGCSDRQAMRTAHHTMTITLHV